MSWQTCSTCKGEGSYEVADPQCDDPFYASVINCSACNGLGKQRSAVMISDDAKDKSLRDWFAGMALVAACGRAEVSEMASRDLAKKLADAAYVVADAMLEARDC